MEKLLTTIKGIKMKLFKRNRPIKQELKPEVEFENLIGIGYMRHPNFDDMYRQYTSEQLEELIASLKETIRFLEYQKSLSVAFHEGQTQEVQHLLENKIEGNLSSLQRDGGWLLGIWDIENKHQ